jgi:hypothetical protein
MTPPVLESLKALAGVCNAERIDAQVKKDAEQVLKDLIAVIGQQASKMRQDSSPLYT